MINNKNLALAGQYESYLDAQGATVIDLTGGFGFQVPDVIEQVVQQADLMGLSNRVLLSEPLIRLCKTVAMLLPEPLNSSYVCSSGDEAFEGALKLCKGLQPKRGTVVYLAGGDYGSLSYGRCMGNPDAYQEMIRFLGLKLKPICYPDDLLAVDWSDCFAVCHPYIHHSAKGNLQLPPEPLLKGLYRHARNGGIPIVGMDVDTCLGSLGTMFGYERVLRTPDVVVLGGALGGGAIPIGLYTCSEQLAYKVYGRSTPAKHGSTTAGNPLSCVAALAALEYARRTDAPKRCSANGQLLADALNSLGATAIGGVVTVPIGPRTDAHRLWGDVYERGVYLPSPAGPELVLRPSLSARPEALSRAASVIMEVMTHAVINAA